MLSVMVLISCASAFQVDFQIGNINGGQPLEDVIIELYSNESNKLNNTITDSSGLASIYINQTETFYSVSYEKLGFHSQYNNITLDTSGDTVLDYLYPISDDGIVRIRITDLLLNNEREYCIYYKENDRLEGCYEMNDTVQLIVNKEYLMVPMITQYDMFTSPENIRRNTPYFSGMIPSLFVLLAVLFTVIWLYRKTKR